MCNNMFCNNYQEQINAYHNDIIKTLMISCAESIPNVKPRVTKGVPGWNEYVDKYFKSALFWHYLWK